MLVILGAGCTHPTWGGCWDPGDLLAGVAPCCTPRPLPGCSQPLPLARSKERRDTPLLKIITSVLFGICYSARVTGYKYILQRASSPPSRGGLRGHAGPGGTGASRPPARAASASRTGSHRARDGGPTRTQEMSPAARPVPSSCFPTPKVPGTVLAADTLPALTGMPRVGSRAAPSPCPAALEPPPALQVPQPRMGALSPRRLHHPQGPAMSTSRCRQAESTLGAAGLPSELPARCDPQPGQELQHGPGSGHEGVARWEADGEQGREAVGSTGCCPGWPHFSCGRPWWVTPRRGWGWHWTVLAAGWDGSKGAVGCSRPGPGVGYLAEIRGHG